MKKSMFIAVNAVLIALAIVFMAIPISIGPVSLAVLMLIPVIIASQTLGFKSALLNSAALGLMSCLFSLLFPVSPLAVLFRNPLVSVLPRLFIGPVIYWVYEGLKKLLKNKKGKEYFASVISTVSGVITNTFLVVFMLWALYFDKEVGGTVISTEFLTGLLALNFVIEIIVCAIIAPPIVAAVKKMLGRSLIKKPEKENSICKNAVDDTESKKDLSDKVEFENKTCIENSTVTDLSPCQKAFADGMEDIAENKEFTGFSSDKDKKTVKRTVQNIR